MGQLQLNSFYRISFNYVVGSHTIEGDQRTDERTRETTRTELFIRVRELPHVMLLLQQLM